MPKLTNELRNTLKTMRTVSDSLLSTQENIDPDSLDDLVNAAQEFLHSDFIAIYGENEAPVGA